MPPRSKSNLSNRTKKAKNVRICRQNETPFQRAYRTARSAQHHSDKEVLKIIKREYFAMNYNTTKGHKHDFPTPLCNMPTKSTDSANDKIKTSLSGGGIKLEDGLDSETEKMEELSPSTTTPIDNLLTNIQVSDIWLQQDGTTCNIDTKSMPRGRPRRVRKASTLTGLRERNRVRHYMKNYRNSQPEEDKAARLQQARQRATERRALESKEGRIIRLQKMREHNEKARRSSMTGYMQAINTLCNTIFEPSVPEEQYRLGKKIHYWTDLQTETLVQEMFEAVKDTPELFEKPSSKAFYEKIKEKSPILQSIRWVSLRNKMRHMKTKYFFAAAWKEKNYADIQIDDIYKKCPHFNTLAVIFKHCTNDKPSIIYESADDDADNKNSIVSEFNSMSDFENCNLSDELQLKIEVESRCGTPQPTDSHGSYDIIAETESKPAPKRRISKRGNTKIKDKQTSTNQQSNYEQQSKDEQLKKKSDIYKTASLISIENKKLALEQKKLQLEKEKQRHAFELRKIELQNDLELKKWEIEKRLESEERLRKYEIELQSK